MFGGMCNSIDGAYECECGFGRWGRHCERVNLCEMLEPCGSNTQTCRNVTDEEYICECEPGQKIMVNFYTYIIVILPFLFS